MSIAELVPPKVRAVIYLLPAMFSAAYGVIEANTSVHWGWQAAWAAWTAGAGLLAAANTRSSTPPG